MSDLGDRLGRIPVPDSEEAQQRTVLAAIERAGARPPEPAGRRFRPARRPLRVALLAVVGVAALFVAANLLRGSNGSSEGGELSSFAAIAAEQPQDRIGYLKWRSELNYEWPDQYAQGARYPDRVKDTLESETWFSADRRYERDTRSYWDGSDKVQRSEFLFDRPSDLYCFTDIAGAEKPSSCTSLSSIDGLSGSLSGPDLPTDPDALRTALEDEVHGIGPTGRRQEPPEPDPCLHEGFGVPLPQSASAMADRQTLLLDLRATAGIDEDSSGYTYHPQLSEGLFSLTSALLASPNSDPALRAGLFRVLAGLDGARVVTDQEDQLGRAATVVEFASPPADPGSGRFARDQLFVDPNTSEVLEQRTSVEETDGSGPEQTLGTYDRLFIERSAVDSLPPEAAGLEETLSKTEAACASGSRGSASGN